ncbi:hypothetical protein, partial [Rhodovulum sulfidophilum]|uniref:hypothetical protein n=1 Tax=Rhodovulum sulfidophilum TaxID=35806 RepID=UPI001F3F6378
MMAESKNAGWPSVIESLLLDTETPTPVCRKASYPLLNGMNGMPGEKMSAPQWVSAGTLDMDTRD